MDFMYAYWHYNGMLFNVLNRYSWIKSMLLIPFHGNRNLPIGTLTRLMKDANLTEDDFKK